MSSFRPLAGTALSNDGFSMARLVLVIVFVSDPLRVQHFQTFFEVLIYDPIGRVCFRPLAGTALSNPSPCKWRCNAVQNRGLRRGNYFLTISRVFRLQKCCKWRCDACGADFHL